MTPLEQMIQALQAPSASAGQDQIRALLGQQLQAPQDALASSLQPISIDQTRDLAQAQTSHDEGTARQYAFGNLGLLSGDSVLSRFGQAQLNDIKAFNPMAFRGQALLLAQRKRETDRAAEIRKEQHQGRSDVIKGLLSLEGLGNSQRDAILKALGMQNTQQNQQQSNETEMRNKLMDHPITKSYNFAKIAVEKLRAAAADGTGASDLGAVFNFMHTLDPTMGVMEGDVANATNARGVPERIKAIYNSLTTGGRLTADQRQDFLRTAEKQFEVNSSEYAKLKKQYSDLALSTGMNPSHVTMDDLSTATPVQEPNPADFGVPPPRTPDVDLTAPTRPTATQLLVKPPPPAPPPGRAAQILLKTTASLPSEDDEPTTSPAEQSKAIAAARSRRAHGEVRVTASAPTATRMTEAEQEETKNPHLQREGESVENTYNRVKAAGLPNSPDYSDLRVVTPKPKEKIVDLSSTGETVRVNNRKGETLAVGYNTGRGIRWLALPHGFLPKESK